MLFSGLLILAFASYSSCVNFDKTHVGVAFEPYTKNWQTINNVNSVPYFNSYSISDIQQMLNVISPKFREIATYSMGVNQWNYNGPYDQADSNCLVAKAAAQINNQSQTVVISVSQGVYQNDDPNIINAEIENAFTSAQDANQVYPNTVWSVTFTNEYFTDVNSGNQILSMITTNRDRAHSMGLKVGTRSNYCGVILNNGTDMYNVLANIVAQSDFIMCNLYPTYVNGRVEDALNSVTGYYNILAPAFRQVNNNVEVIIGETGWPSQGISFNNSPNNVTNMKEYWAQMNDWASQNQVRVYMFEAIDEPWKSNMNSGDMTASDGPNGGEGHYGLWTRQDTPNGPIYVEK